MKILSETKKRGRPKSVPAKSGQTAFDFDAILSVIERSGGDSEAAETIKAMLAIKDQRTQWRGAIAIPPATILEAILGEFRTKTNIPLEVPFFTVISAISGYLLKKGVVVKTSTGEIQPDIWTIVLAASGAGKTYTQTQVGKGIDITEFEFNGTGLVSAAAFVQKLESMPRGLWVRDEYARFLNTVEIESGPMAEMKDYLLRLYDNATISRETKKETISVEKPAISILGMTVLDTFGKYVTAESMLDGFAQRFAYVIAKSDPERPWTNYPLWKVDSNGWAEKWAAIKVNIKDFYYAEDVMQPAFSQSFQMLFNEIVPESFYRRLMWKANKYALIYHVLKCDTSDKLTAEDYGWAARLISLHVQDAAYLIGDHNLTALERVLVKAEEIIIKVKATGKTPTARDLVRGVSALKTTAQAEQILKMIDI